MISKMKTAGVLALVVGVLSIFAGGMAMRGWNPGYSVLGWLPVYNFVMGVLTVFIPAILLWRESRHAGASALIFFGVHAVVTVLLLLAFRDVVATQSILAMTFRLAVWLVILALIRASAQKTK
ncbi:MAG: hypothetical protein IPJ47_09445 [Anaerolineales bacterium]|nr:hypothetical protein [Anaerolineales bacterium]